MAKSKPAPERPEPPRSMFAPDGRAFEPAPDLWPWARETFVLPGAPLHNPDHEHLTDAAIGFIWTTEANARQMLAVVGQAELPAIQGNRWARGRHEQLIGSWFGEVPDFLITLSADYAVACDPVSFAALVEHELYHCGQLRGPFGEPRFTRAGKPMLAIRGHDVEEFVGIVRRYGVGAGAGATAAFVEAAQREPEIAEARVAGVCGTCRAAL